MRISMKKLFFLMVTAMVVLACSQSPEQKAEALIKESLKKTLINPETYKPVETKVDSAFSPNDSPELFKLLGEVADLYEKYEDLNDKAQRKKSYMLLHSDSYTAFGRNEYETEKAEYEKYSAESEQVNKKYLKRLDEVFELLKSEKKFIGYKVYHNYRADNDLGNTLIGNAVFFIDENFTEVNFALELDQYKYINEGINEILERMEEAEEEDNDDSHNSEK